MVREPQVAPYDVAQQAGGGGVRDHGAEGVADGGEPLGGGADVPEPVVGLDHLLEDEGGDGAGELDAAVHGLEAERDEVGGEEEADDLGLVGLHEGAEDAEAGEAEVVEGAGGVGGGEEGVEQQGEVGAEEGGAGVGVGGDALEQGERVADAVGGGGGEVGGGGEEAGVDRGELLEEERDDRGGVPEGEGEVGVALADFGEFVEGGFAGLWLEELADEGPDFGVFAGGGRGKGRGWGWGERTVGGGHGGGGGVESGEGTDPGDGGRGERGVGKGVGAGGGRVGRTGWDPAGVGRRGVERRGAELAHGDASRWVM